MTAPKLLVVDDDIDICNAVSIYARKQGYEVSQAHRGDEALDIAEQQQPDVILLDVMLPGLDGRDVMARLNKSGLSEKAVVIFLTARDSQSDRIVGLDLGAVEYETKPMHLGTLFDKIGHLLRKRQRGEI